MENHFDLSDRELEIKFSNGTLESSLFTHEAHLRLSWIYISREGITEATKKVCIQLQNYVTILGAREKYNVTVTVAAMEAVHHFILKSKTETFKDFILENHRLKNNFKELLAQHYVTNIFNSEKAKKEFFAPELLPFD